MKGAGGMRTMYRAVAAAMATMAFPKEAAPSIMDRAPGFMGVGRSVPRALRTYVRNNGGKGRPHQGAKECERRRRQLCLGEFKGITPSPIL